jgi:hypothetical protein
MSRFAVQVTSEWRSTTTFEFDDEQAANDFFEKVDAGGSEGLDAMVEDETAELDTSGAELVDWSVSSPRSEGR